ncbi:IS256 family transposase [Carboxydothermus pertinax]|uniref:Mutator family transposase n=1 Tax=Carboxydothermus pertinax TaxID=870242 RepID=A0A1L8CWJ3_9THEO|nr:IS256 family transposase [Carboxydothermus pertinax]GAV23282.1 IS256 family transposase [Carboxydothermus pertinax]
MQNLENLTVKDLARQCKSIEDIYEALKNIFSDTIQQLLEAELEHHLGYQKYDPKGKNSGNSRNGYSKKTLKTRLGPTEIEIPRDRNGEFEPQVIKKYQTTANELEDQIISMYAKGMTNRDIEAQMKDIYGIDVSPALVSKITDKIMPQITEWQARPLERVYPIVYFDAIHFKVRQDGRIINKAAYTVLGINTSGYKDILGIWIGENESATFWLNVFNDLKNRGVEDILIVSKDGLSGFSEAIKAVFPKAEIQLCVIHQIRNSLKYVSYKDRKNLMADLKKVYGAATLEEAELGLLELKEKWDKKYPIVSKSWERNWDELSTYFKYPQEIRKLIYTTNIVEGYHRQLRKVTKVKTTYPTDDSLRKILYLATVDILKKWTMPIKDWGLCVSQFTIYFGERMII